MFTRGEAERLLPSAGGHPDHFYEALLGLRIFDKTGVRSRRAFVARWALEAARVL